MLLKLTELCEIMVRMGAGKSFHDTNTLPL